MEVERSYGYIVERMRYDGIHRMMVMQVVLFLPLLLTRLVSTLRAKVAALSHLQLHKQPTLLQLQLATLEQHQWET